MQKHSDRLYHFDLGIPLLISTLLGILFFGSYLAVEHFVAKALPKRSIALLFLCAYILFSVIALVICYIKQRKERGEETLHESLNTKMHNMFKYVVGLPYLIADEQGRVRAMNQALQNLLDAKSPFFRGNVADVCGGVTLHTITTATERGVEKPKTVTRLTEEALNASAENAVALSPETVLGQRSGGTVVTIEGKGRYIARAYEVGLSGKPNFLVTFTDVSDYLDLCEKTERDMPAVAYIDVDNLEELTQYTRVNYRDASRRVDDILLHWAAEMGGLLREYERDRYIMLFSQEKLRLCEADKFGGLLDRIREIRLGEYSIPVTVSVGISLADSTMAERAAEAQAALDMALQRGGDQVAVRRKDGIRYYGGQTRPFRRRTKVQSRVVANYLLSKISESDNLLVMGHRNPDFDSIGAAVGLAQLGLLAGVPTNIVMDLSSTNFRVAAERLLSMDTYADMFVSGHKGLSLVRPGTLLIIADANNFNIIESPDVAAAVRKLSGKIAIVDHHRQTGEYDFEPVMTYIEPSASSACELVAEMLEQSESGTDNDATAKLVSDEVASVILSGIMLDTGSFTRNTSARTLDAARYLFGKGANAEHVHTFFNQEYDDYVRERSFSGAVLLQGGTVGLTWSKGTGQESDDRVAAAKAADRLLDVKGIRAAFALIAIDGAIHISGRSDGSVNVQLILERLGGGGRFDSAGAALSGKTVDDAVKQLSAAVKAHFDDLETR